MKLVFKKEWDELTGNYQVLPYTEDGQLVENCIACSVESMVGIKSRMTLTIESVEKMKGEE